MTFVECTWLNGKHTVFGQVVDGWDVLDEMEKVGSSSGQTKKKVFIYDSG